jgi:lysophospholipase L1-like esterase
MTVLLTIFMAFTVWAAAAQSLTGTPGPLTPATKTTKFLEGSWMERHEKFVQRAKQGDVALLWLGDSITDNWKHFRGTFGKYYANYKTANFGISGDQTQNLLWRLQNGELEGIQPKITVLLVGTNNVQWDPADQVAAGIAKIVETIRAKCPTTKILLMAIFPRGDLPATSSAYQRIKEVNTIIAKLDDGKNVRYLDISAKLTNPDGSIPAEIMSDKVHLVTKGFQIWAESLQPFLDEVIKKNP